MHPIIASRTKILVVSIVINLQIATLATRAFRNKAGKLDTINFNRLSLSVFFDSHVWLISTYSFATYQLKSDGTSSPNARHGTRIVKSDRLGF